MAHTKVEGVAIHQPPKPKFFPKHNSINFGQFLRKPYKTDETDISKRSFFMSKKEKLFLHCLEINAKGNWVVGGRVKLT